MSTIADALVKNLRSAGHYNRAAQLSPVAVLWPDHEEQWTAIVGTLRNTLKNLFVLGRYSPEENQGPAIWLKCVVGRTVAVPQYPEGVPPLLYLPHVARADLRAVDQCPRELQPLAELQYRGAIWSQQNGKDWTLSAFLSSENGGLGLELSDDNATRQALARAAAEATERLLELRIAELQGRQLNAEFFDSLLSPDHERDLLFWLNDSKAVAASWKGARWKLFVERSKKDYGFSPDRDGELTAAEKLARQEGAWKSVWALYRDLAHKYGGIEKVLERIAAPAELFIEKSGFPAFNSDAEKKLRGQLKELRGVLVTPATQTIAELESEHGIRRQWLWCSLGKAPLAKALEHLSTIGQLVGKPFGGASVESMATQYQDAMWKVDDAALRAISSVKSKEDLEAIQIALMAIYVPWLESSARRFQDLVKAVGGLGAGKAREQSEPYAFGHCVLFVDGLRYDVGMRLQQLLCGKGADVTIRSSWTTTPSVTASGKAWVSPVRGGLSGSTDDREFQPRVSSTGSAATTQALRALLEQSGWQVLGINETGKPGGRAWTEYGDLDHYGHEHGLRLAKDIDEQLERIAERIQELLEGGWNHIRVVTDHGWLLVPGGMQKVNLPKFLADTRWGRCAVLKDSASSEFPLFGWDWNTSVQVAVAPGISSFIAGAEYAHGGLSLQESLVPEITVRPGSLVKVTGAKVLAIKWTGLRCKVHLETTDSNFRADIRLKAADPETSVLATEIEGLGKPIIDGQVSLAVRDDQEGVAAALVVIDSNGAVIAKQTTTIGE